MKLLLSAYACRPDMGTEPGNGWNWARHLAQAGQEVYCLTATHNRPFVERHLRDEPVDHLQMIYVAVPAWVQWLRQQHYQTFLYLHYWFWQRAAYQRARRLHQDINFDVAHHVTYGSLQMGSLLGKLNVPFIFGPVGGGQSAPRAFRTYLKQGWYKEQLRDFFSNSLLVNIYQSAHTLRSADLVLATNHETHERASQWGARNVRMAADFGLPAEFYPGSLPERSFTDTKLRLLWIGSVIPRKGLLLLIDVMATLPKNVTLTLVGDGSQMKLVQNRIMQLQLVDRVQCVGRVPFSQVRDYYASHDAFIFTSLRDSSGAQLVEAMAFGLPIITLDHQGAHTCVPYEAGIKVPPTDPATTVAELSHAALRLLAYPEERRAMSQAAYEYAQTQQWPRRVKDTIHQYESLLAYSV